MYLPSFVTPETVGGVGLVALGLWGGWQQFKQAQIIYKKGHCNAISTEGMLIQLFMGYVTVVYGSFIGSIPMLVHGASRILGLYVILRGIKKYRGFSRMHSALRIGMHSMILSLLLLPYKGQLYLAFSIFALWGSISQVIELWNAKQTGALDIRLQCVYFISASFWLIYGLGIHDTFIIAMSMCFIVLLVMIIGLWFFYFFRERKVATVSSTSP
ncbi:MAG: SemiSWEET family transporter [Patescibacteria group bacterium]